MKLNNHGWGMRDMIIYTCILLLFLLIAIFFIQYLYSQIDDNVGTKNNDSGAIYVENESVNDETEVNYTIYSDYEEEMKEAAIEYVLDQNIILNQNIETIMLDKLVDNGYIDDLKDQKDDSICNGYANVWDNEVGVYEAEAYISCNNYKTEGY